MSREDRIETLKARHRDIDNRLQQEIARPYPDETVLRTLKHEKLSLKDEIQRMQPA